jgi:hypothetical protein
MTKRALASFLLPLAIVLGGCYSPHVVDGQYLCSAGTCPDGQTCSRCGICVAQGDLSIAGDGCPGCAAGVRSPGDFTLAGLALCPASWTVPGVSATATASLSTPCGRTVGAGGKGADGTACTVEDNCALGWHVCTDDADASKHGLSSSRCDSLDAQMSFWVTRQGAALVEASKSLKCGPTGTALVGCGALQSTSPLSGCSALTRTMGDVSASSTCASASNNVWQCGSPGMEVLEVTKPLLTKGGVMCCRD